LVELRVRGRLANLIKPTGKVDPQKRWVWDFPFWLAINDRFGHVAHRHYVEKLLAAGFHVAGFDADSAPFPSVRPQGRVRLWPSCALRPG
jgi:hypothetical protein